MSTARLIQHSEPYAVIENITPEIAERLVSRTYEGQRKLRKSLVDRYAKEMAEGRWRFTTDAWGVDEFGFLCQGQHRARAVIQSGVTIKAWVIYNQPRESFVGVDQGGSRTAVDIGNYLGVHATFNMTAIAAHMREGFWYTTSPSKTAVLETLQEHRLAIEFVVKGMVTTRGLGQASVLAPIARAYYSQSHDRLTEFLEVLKTGMSGGQQSGDEAAILLRNWLLGMSGGSGRTRKKVIYAKASKRRRRLTNLQVPVGRLTRSRDRAHVPKLET